MRLPHTAPQGRVRLQDGPRPGQEPLDELAVPVDEEDVAHGRVDLEQGAKALVAPAGRVHQPAGIELDHVHALGAGVLHASVGGVRIRVDDGGAVALHARQGATQALPLVAGDDDDPGVFQLRHGYL